MNDLISRQAAIDALDGKIEITGRTNAEAVKGYVRLVKDRLERLPSAQSEPAIPLSWIEGQIEWLKSLDNEFSTLTAGQILAMMNKWKDEQDG